LNNVKKKDIAQLAQGISVVHLYSGQLKKLNINIPKLPEQQKIASCLSTIDDFIKAQNQKLDALKTHKKGLMQQLFPAEGETVPKLRFEEFRDKGDWEEKALGNLGEFTGGGTPSKANDSFWKGSIPWVSSSDIFEDSIHQIKISRFITEEALKDSATKLVPENSILLVSRVGVGKLAISKQPVCTSQDFTNFTPDKDNLMFLAYILKSHSKTLLEYSQGMAIKGFTKDDILKLKMFIPTPEEQQKIADCLSSIDELISAQSQKLDALKAHKKGLMQGLFPCGGDPAWSSKI
jgi:type I restriction enzyme S subunit